MSPPHWSPTPLPAAVVALAAEGDAAYAGLADGRVLRSSEGAWRLAADAGAPISLLLPAPAGLLVSGRHGLHRIAPDGRVERAVGIPEPAVVVALAHAKGIAVAGTRTRGVFRSDDGGATWAEANLGLPYRGRGLGISGLAATGTHLLVAHPLGVSRSPDGGRAWEPAGAGLPLRLGRLAVAASGPRSFAEADGHLFHLDGEAWAERSADAVGLLGADADALYGVDAAGRLVWCAPDGGPWTAYGEGLPEAPLALVSGATWRWAALVSGALWRRPVTLPPRSSPGPQLAGVPPFLTGVSTEATVTLASPADVVLALVGPDGDEAARLVDGPLAAGAHRVTLSAGGLTPGLYQCRLVAGGAAVSRPLAVLP